MSSNYGLYYNSQRQPLNSRHENDYFTPKSTHHWHTSMHVLTPAGAPGAPGPSPLRPRQWLRGAPRAPSRVAVGAALAGVSMSKAQAEAAHRGRLPFPEAAGRATPSVFSSGLNTPCARQKQPLIFLNESPASQTRSGLHGRGIGMHERGSPGLDGRRRWPGGGELGEHLRGRPGGCFIFGFLVPPPPASPQHKEIALFLKGSGIWILTPPQGAAA